MDWLLLFGWDTVVNYYIYKFSHNIQVQLENSLLWVFLIREQFFDPIRILGQ